MRRLRGTNLWYASVELPPGARMEYRLLVRHGDNVENILDPLNRRQVTGPAGQMSVLEAAGYESPWWTVYNPASVPGETTELTMPSRALRRDVHVTVYSPGRMRMDDRLPLLVLHDGADFLNHASMGVVLDNLMDRRLVADCVVAFTHPADRLKEYGAGAAHSRFLTAELVPQLEKRLPLRGEPAGRFLAGASFGGIAALTAAVRAPGFYGGLLLQSPSFLFTLVGRGHEGGPVFDPVVRFVNGDQGQSPARGREDLRQLRRVRTGSPPHPGDGGHPRTHGRRGPGRRVARRPHLDGVARPDARRPRLAASR